MPSMDMTEQEQQFYEQQVTQSEQEQGTSPYAEEPTESQDTQTDPQSETEAQPSDDTTAIFRQMAHDALERERRLQQRLEELEGKSRQTSDNPPPDKETDPIGYMEWLIDQKTKPTNEFIQTQRRQQTFANNAAPVFQKYPALAPYQQQIMGAVWNIFANSNVEPTPLAIETYTQAYVGQMLLQNPSLLTQSAPQSNGNVPNNRPPVPNRAPNTPPASRAPAPKLTPSQLEAFNALGFKPGQEKEFLERLNSSTRTFDF